MASFMVDLWESIFTPGPTPTILKAANASFAALQLVLAVLLAATASVHFAVLSVLSAGLWWSINWFAAELAIAQERQRRDADDNDDGKKTKKKKRRLGDDAETSSDTEVEGSSARGATDVASGELRQRTAPAQASPAGTPSSVSTEDEWEKVSGGERDKAS